MLEPIPNDPYEIDVPETDPLVAVAHEINQSLKELVAEIKSLKFSAQLLKVLTPSNGVPAPGVNKHVGGISPVKSEPSLLVTEGQAKMIWAIAQQHGIDTKNLNKLLHDNWGAKDSFSVLKKDLGQIKEYLESL